MRIDFDLLEVSDRVFTQEVKAKNVGRLQRDMFTTKRATAHGVGLVFALLVTSSKSKNVDEVHGRGPLSVCHLFRFEIFPVICTDPIDMVLQDIGVNDRSGIGGRPHCTFSSRAFSNLDISL